MSTLTLILAATFVAAAPEPEPAQDSTYGHEHLEPGEHPEVPWEVLSEDEGHCTFCREAFEEDGSVLMYRGRRVYICERDVCKDHWLDDPEGAFVVLQPRAGLFDEPAAIPGQLRLEVFWVGVWILVGLLSGAGASYLAMNRGHPPMPWFLAGLAFNVIALALVWTRPKLEDPDCPEGIPPGLQKAPVTRRPVPCGECGNTNHPSAAECSSCGATLVPSAESETRRV